MAMVLAERFKNLSGPRSGHLFAGIDRYVLDWVMSLDPTWFSSINGLCFIVSRDMRRSPWRY